MTSRYTVVITPQAERDLIEIHAWITVESQSRAASMISRIEARLASLVVHPFRHTRAPEGEWHDLTIRHFSVGPFRILYAVERSTVHVLRIGHGARRTLPPNDEE